jgi:hypothetical protein
MAILTQNTIVHAPKIGNYGTGAEEFVFAKNDQNHQKE